MKSLLEQYTSVRHQTEALTEGLSPEDLCVQSMADASPGKWHLGHTTWFFETFILQQYESEFHWHNEDYSFLFNSYYDSVGERHARPQRGLLTRPSLDEVIKYRHVIDERMKRVIQARPDDITALVTIGLHHEMQHQELLLTDLLHLLSCSPLKPAVLSRSPSIRQKLKTYSAPKMVVFDGGLVEVGVNALTQNNQNEKDSAEYQNSVSYVEGFSYDCEQPRHSVYVSPFKLASRLVSNADWIAFMEAGGYDNSLLWLSDGWAIKCKEAWQAPGYWENRDDGWWQFGLDGMQPIDPNAPVHHVSMYEADAFARWSGKRLPREHELELLAESRPVAGNFLESYAWRPFVAESGGEDFEDIYGDVWEWTQSAFSPYPGFDPKQGALGEYNGKFMANQFVLKGGSCATPRLQMRSSYRNFFHPQQRWQFTGLRLAEDSVQQ